MVYNILNIADIHFGAMKPDQLLYELEIIDEFIEEAHDIIDMIIINGDYWDSKLGLYSKSAIAGINWITELVTKCNYKNIQVVIYKGTLSHDDDQLEIFRSLEESMKRFTVITENTFMKIENGPNLLFLPDENMNLDEYYIKYIDNYLRNEDIHIGFFHGNADFVMKNFMTQESELNSVNSVMFEYDYWNKIIKGPMIAGHWHTYMQKGNWYYVGSYSRWKYGEEDPKGALFLSYNTDTNEWFTERIINYRAPQYLSYTIATELYNSVEDYLAIIEKIRVSLEEIVDLHVKIEILITDDKQENDSYIQLIKDSFVGNKRTKITIKNKIEKDKREVKKQEERKEIAKYGFIMDGGLSESEIFQRFILSKYDEEIPLEFIEKTINKIMKK